ncbi:MAG TPA: 16S rRNA (cytosine(1402)-N(4))-methyltransferase RsmH [Terriglobia bacterium]|nr:16S rRNA (cytosine(1402)-N(4))-methyltransferase RsmH [Terriglobia bacterium]
MSRGHIPVLSGEVATFLDPQPGGRFIDATVGGAGHARMILEKTAPDGRLLGLDRDGEALKRASGELESFGDRVTLIQANFRDILPAAAAAGFLDCNGVLADIGVSSPMLDEPERGFSFMREGPLDMRMDRTQELTAAEVVNRSSERDIADILYRFGEERRSRPIARAIVRARPLTSTGDLVRAITSVTGSPRYGQIHPATRSFQALRIFVNDELGSLEGLLDGAMTVLAPGGRLVVIAFHSLEDRIVKNRFRSAPHGRVLTKKVVTASEEESRRNPRARSAKLRAWEKTNVQQAN